MLSYSQRARLVRLLRAWALNLRTIVLWVVSFRASDTKMRRHLSQSRLRNGVADPVSGLTQGFGTQEVFGRGYEGMVTDIGSLAHAGDTHVGAHVITISAIPFIRVATVRSNSGAQAWRGQTTGAVLPRASLRTFSKGQMLSPDAVIADWRPRELSRQSPTLTASGPFRSSPEIQPAINTHRSRSGQRFCPSTREQARGSTFQVD